MQHLSTPLFVPECYADTALMRTLLRENSANQARLRAGFVNHQHGIGNVGNLMASQWQPGTARRVLGLVDLDRKFDQQPYLSAFTQVLGGSRVRGAAQHVLLQHPQRPSQVLLALNPVFETWLATRATEIGTTLAAYGIPAEANAFKSYSRAEDKNPDSGLRRLLDAIAVAYHPAYRALAEFVAQVMDLTRPLP